MQSSNQFVTLNQVALRQQAIYVPVSREKLRTDDYECSEAVILTVQALSGCGYWVTEEALHALCTLSAEQLEQLVGVVNNALGTNLNWSALRRGWTHNIPRYGDEHPNADLTFLANRGGCEASRCVQLPCGHLIPPDSFDLEHYTGCPYCGTPFTITPGIVYTEQGSKKRPLALFTDEDMTKLLRSLLETPVPLDATQADSLRRLLTVYPLPADVTIAMKETMILAVDALVDAGKADRAVRLLTSPAEVLRYLWYKKTARTVIIEPRYMIAKSHKWRGVYCEGPYIRPKRDLEGNMKKHLSLHYSRRMCRIVAEWLNALPGSAGAQAESMHPHRDMWVRFIRALRLPEYARRPGFERLARLLDVFYRGDYTVWNGQLDKARREGDRDRVLEMLSQRPGFFARSLFATMLRFGTEPVLEAFMRTGGVAPRLVLSLIDAAGLYFDPHAKRYAVPVTGGRLPLPPNPLLVHNTPEDIEYMKESIDSLLPVVLRKHFIKDRSHEGHKIYIAPELFNIPVAVGDRATTVQDTSSAVQGERFRVEGRDVRIFLNWGEGLPAQYLDLDLSAVILYKNGAVRNCDYTNLLQAGAVHSGDIRSIPAEVGTAEYVELDLRELRRTDAQYVLFMCNAYSMGTLTVNARVGWMSSLYPMQVSNETGVAFDPSCVQHMVHIPDCNIAKGMTFGVLDVERAEITWLEITNNSQVARTVNTQTVTDYLRRLRRKMSLGRLLRIKAEAQNMTEVDNPANADEVYDRALAYDPALINELLS